jgi:hypothetical protein
MSRILIIALCFVVMAQSFQKTWIVASWKANRDYIAATLCENREVATSTCSGSCYLTKQLKEQEQQEQKAPLNEKEKVDFVSEFFFYAFAAHSFRKIDGLSFPMLWEYGKPLHIGFSIFHPPSVLG